MIKTTRAQRERLLEVYNRATLYEYDGKFISIHKYMDHKPATYRQFRAGIHPTFGCDDAVIVQWCGMWLCIEKDGYCHS